MKTRAFLDRAPDGSWVGLGLLGLEATWSRANIPRWSIGRGRPGLVGYLGRTLWTWRFRAWRSWPVNTDEQD